MATITGPSELSFQPSQQKFAEPKNYVDLTTLLDLSKTDFPDFHSTLTQPFGDQTLMDFCRMIGSHTPLGANEAQWFEDPRLHNIVVGVITATIQAGALEATVTPTTPADVNIRVNDVILDGVQNLYVTEIAAANATFKVKPYKNWATTYAAAGAISLMVVGNDHNAGSDQQSEFIESGAVLRSSSTMIIKDIYKATGSQETNRAWIPIPSTHSSGGGWVWYLKNEGDQRKRFENYLIMSMILGEVRTAASAITTDISGTEGLIPAIKDRGINSAGAITAEADMDAIVLALAKVRADTEYSVWQSTDHLIGMYKLIADVAGAAPNASYGIFGNDKNMAVNAGFSSYERAGYTFHLKKWDLLDDPTLLGAFPDFLKAVFIPGGKRRETKSGLLTNAWSIRYKEQAGYNREMEHWLTGSGAGVKTDGRDLTQFNYRAEIASQVFGATRFIQVAG